MQNLTKGEMIFRVMLGILIAAALYIPETIGTWLLLVLAGILVVSGIVRYCPVCHIVDKK